MDYFIPGLEREAYMKASAVLMHSIYNELKIVFTGSGIFKGTFSLQVRCPLDLWYMHYNNYSKISWIDYRNNDYCYCTLDVDKTLEWYNRFQVVPKPYGKVNLCFNPTWLNQVFIRPVYRGSISNNIFHNLIFAH